jgi:hypothetical protein
MFGANAFGAIPYGGTFARPFILPKGFQLSFIINGTTPAQVRYPSVSIHDVLGAQPNTGSLTFATSEPTVGEAIEIRVESATVRDVLFAGQVQQFARTYESRPIPATTMWPADLIDHTFALNRRRPFGSYRNVSATTVAQQLVAAYASGFTTANVAAGLPAVTINFDGSEPLLEALNRVATMVGARCKVDYLRDVHIYIDESSISTPDPITVTHPPLNTPPISFEIDLSQVRTRVYGKGIGTSVLGDVVAHDTILPVEDASQFTATGGQAITGLTPDAAQTVILGYTGVQLGGGGAIVGIGVTPSVQLTAQILAGAGLPSGTYTYAYTWVTSLGETTPSPMAGVTVVGTLAPPSPAPTVALQPSAPGTGVDVGHAYKYVVTFVIASGETTPGPESAQVWGSASIPPPSPAPTVAGQPSAPGTGVDGYHSYKYVMTFVSASGETTPGPESAQVYAGPYVNAPSAAPTLSESALLNGTNFWQVGDYLFVAVTYRTSDGGETYVGPYSNQIQATVYTPGYVKRLDIRGLPIPSEPQVTAKRVWLNINNAWRGYFEVAPGVNDLLNVYYYTTPPSAPPTQNTADYRGIIRLSNLPVGPAGTTEKRVYRWRDDVTSYKRVWPGSPIANATTTVDDNQLQSSLGGAPPTSNTAWSQGLIRLSNLPVGPAGTTEKRIYRWRDDVGVYHRVWPSTPIANATTTIDDDQLQSSLGGAPPTSNTATAAQVQLTNVATGPSGTTARRIYRGPVNSSVLQLLPTGSTFANNSTTGPYTDINADATLGAAVPTTDTSGLTQAGGQVNAGSTSLPTTGTGPFATGGGWAHTGQQVVRYTGISGVTLTGIPGTGPGAILTTILYGSQIVPVPALLGVTGLTAAVARGSSVHIWVQRDDVAAQQALGQLERDPTGTPTDGIREYQLSDERRVEPSLIEYCDTDLARFAHPVVSVTYATRDRKTRAGAIVHIDLGWGYPGDYLIQDVTITIDPSPAVGPRYSVRASSAKFTFVDLLQRVLLEQK